MIAFSREDMCFLVFHSQYVSVHYVVHVIPAAMYVCDLGMWADNLTHR